MHRRRTGPGAITVGGTAYPHIGRKANGAPVIDGTRITVAHVALDHRAGRTAEQMIADYPSLSLGQVYSALAYYYDHQDEIDRYVEERDRSIAEMRATQGQTPQRAKLIAAKREMGRRRA